MPDTKITALTAISTVNPATYPLPIVDTADTTMAASGTTKKITVNQILGSGGTATLASATISGDLTVRTNKLSVTSTGVGVGMTPITPLSGVLGAGGAVFFRTTDPAAPVASPWFQTPVSTGYSSTAPVYGFWYQASGIGNPAVDTVSVITASSERYRIAADGITTWSNVGGSSGTAMTLNSTGLGVGVVSANGIKLSSFVTTDGAPATSGTTQTSGSLRIGAASTTGAMDMGTAGSYSWIQVLDRGNLATNYDLVLQKNGGNVGIGVTPSAWRSTNKALQVGSYSTLTSSSAGDLQLFNNAYINSGGANIYQSNGFATRYEQYQGVHAWYTAPSGTANNPISGLNAFVQMMTLDASGNLLVGTTAAAAGRLDVRRTTVGRGINYFSTASGDLAQVGLYIGKFDNDSTTSQKFIAFSINNDSAGSGQINANGANQAAFGSFSDSRLKENIVSLPSQLDNILSLRPVEFDYKDGSGHQIGFVAQEMQQVYSDAVGESDGFLTVTGWSKTEARLVSAIKELAAKVQALEAKLA